MANEKKLMARQQELQDSWHALDAAGVLSALQTDTSGLSSQEAENRLQLYGANTLTPPKKRSLLLRFLLQFHNVLIYVLLSAGLTTVFLRHWIDASVIFGVVVINALIGFIQEDKAEKALEAIRDSRKISV